jgi:hypothetical protein
VVCSCGCVQVMERGSGSGEMGRLDGVVVFGWTYGMYGVVGVSIRLAYMDGPIGSILWCACVVVLSR